MPVNSNIKKNNDDEVKKLCLELEKELKQLRMKIFEVKKDINVLANKNKMVNIFQKIVNLPDK